MFSQGFDNGGQSDTLKHGIWRIYKGDNTRDSLPSSITIYYLDPEEPVYLGCFSG